MNIDPIEIKHVIDIDMDIVDNGQSNNQTPNLGDILGI